MPFHISSLNDLKEILENKRKQGQKIVFTNGCFDLLHIGHVRYLSEAKKLGNVLVVGVNSDESVKRLKGSSRPLQTEGDRAEILEALKAVDYAVIFTQDTPKDLIESLCPDVLVKGGDWAIKDIVGADFVQSRGGQVYSLNFVDGKSTSKIIEKMSKD